MEEKNTYLRAHTRAKVETAIKHLEEKKKKLHIQKWVFIKPDSGQIKVNMDQEALKRTEVLDGCYVLKTDLSKKEFSKEIIHARYKDLAFVEKGFRTLKTGLLNMRPVFVRIKEHTDGHVFVLMLSLLVARELERAWKESHLTVVEGLDELSAIRSIVFKMNHVSCQKIPEPKEMAKKLLKAANIHLPETIASMHGLFNTSARK